ncbi:MAG: spore coat associated protein CotJA [Clostridia bacterium]|nr:spore coat associated protein CotJA [Clostridia bacterium]
MAEMNGQYCPYPRCGCVGYGYVPVQEMEEMYDACTGLVRGTIFPELDLTICEYGKVCKQWGGGME